MRGSALRGSVRRSIAALLRSLLCAFCSDVGAADQDIKSGAAAGRAALRVDVVCGSGGVCDSGPTYPDPGRGEVFLYH